MQCFALDIFLKSFFQLFWVLRNVFLTDVCCLSLKVCHAYLKKIKNSVLEGKKTLSCNRRNMWYMYVVTIAHCHIISFYILFVCLIKLTEEL